MASFPDNLRIQTLLVALSLMGKNGTFVVLTNNCIYL